MKHVFLTLLLALFSVSVYAQSGTVRAKVVDAESGADIPGAVVAITPVGKPDQTKRLTSGYGGAFTVSALRYGDYELVVSFLGYNEYKQNFTLKGVTLDLGTLALKPGVEIETVVKEVQSIRASQKGDTISYNAGAFKVTADADVEGLLKKMPGITITDGKVETQGEEVKKVFVDGKEFFGEDVTTAIKSLPAETVDRIEVYNKLSDAAEFSGMDDGEGFKALNIVTHRHMRQGQFGKLYAGLGYDAEDGAEDRLKYLAGGNVNIFKGDSRLSVLALFNNVNQQNFSFEDILGVSGGGGGRPGRGVGQYMMRPQSGIAKVNAIGLNYSDMWGKKLTVQGSYFFNNTDTDNRSTLEKWYEAPMKVDTLMTRGVSNTVGNNHRLNARIEWKISENHNLMIRPYFSYQGNDPMSTTEGWQFGESGYSRTDNFNDNERYGYNLGSRMVYRAKLGKVGRTLTVNANVRYSDQQNDGISYSNRMKSLEDRPGYVEGQEGNDPWGWNPTDYTDLRYLVNTAPSKSYDLSGEMTYTEPVSKNSQVSLQYRADWERDERDKSSYETASDYDITGLLPDPSLSNNYRSTNMEHRIGPGFRYAKGKNTFVANLYYQISQLEGEVISGQTVGEQQPIKQDYNHLTYFMMGQLNLNQENSLRLYVRSNTSTPSITNLQSVYDVSDAQHITRGNPDLKPAYAHSVNFHYVNSNLEKGRTFMWMFSWNKTQDYTATHLLQSPGVMEIGGVSYAPNFYSMPVNLDGQWSLRTMLSYGLPINFLKSNFNMMAGINYSKTPSMIGGRYDAATGTITGGERNDADNMGYSFRAVLGSNISEKVDFTLAWNGTYNEATNSLATGNEKNRYFNHSANASMKFVLPWSFTFTASAVYSQYLGITNDYDEDYLICNIYVGKKLFKNKRGEILFGVNDLLNQNNVAFSRTTGSGYTQNATNLSMGRYYMVQFTYNLRVFGKKGSRNMSDYESSAQKEFRQHRRMMGPPPGGGGGFGPR